jgi:hypothetical protein
VPFLILSKSATISIIFPCNWSKRPVACKMAYSIFLASPEASHKAYPNSAISASPRPSSLNCKDNSPICFLVT